MPAISKLGVIAGNGMLPLEIAESAREQGIDVHVFVMRDQGDSTVFEGDYPTTTIRIGAAAAAIKAVREAGITDLVFAGGVRRPSLLELRPDAKATQIIGRGIMSLGDDGLLKAIMAYLENKEGFRIHSIDTILPGIRPSAGQLGSVAMPVSVQSDIRRGMLTLNALAEHDVGQAVVVQDGLVLGIEAIEGTESLIDRCRGLRRDGSPPVLIKMSKPQQTARMDLPAIGPDTIAQVQSASFGGIAVEANRSLIISRDECIAAADAAGLFLFAVDRDDIE